MIALLAALPSLAGWAYFGILETPDTGGYLAYAQQIFTHTVPTGYALLHSPDGRISLFRIGGFPALIAMLQFLCPAWWKLCLVLLQIAAQSGVVAASFFTALRLGARRDLAAAAALLPGIGFVAFENITILTDALNGAAVTGAALALLLRPHWRGALLAGLLLGAATSFREATVYLVLVYAPLALLTQRRLLCVLLVVLPSWGVAGAQISWNMSRGAGPVLTTSKQVVMVQALLPLISDHVPVYAADPAFNAAAAQTINIKGYAGIDDFHNLLYAQGYTPPQIAAEASRDYAHAWRHFPLQMLGATLLDFRMNFLLMPCEPQQALDMMYICKTGHRGNFDRLSVLWHRFRGGNAGDGVLIICIFFLEIFGTSISILGLATPWLLRRDWRLRALWCVPVGLTGLYMPVHLEPRYLIPAVPLICILAASGVTRWLQTRHESPAFAGVTGEVGVTGEAGVAP